jgi:VWFA-related protein
MLKIAITTAALALLALRAQEPYFRVSADLVQVDAVVTDSKGNHVRNLEAADFQIFEDGKPQKITHFSRMEGNRTPARAEGVGPTSGNPTKEEVSRSIVFMFDDSTPHAEELVMPIIPAVRKLVAEQVGTNDLTAVTASRGGMGFYQQLTSDKQQIYAALDRLAHRPGFGIWTIDMPLVRNPDTNRMEPAFQLKDGEPGLGYRDPKHPPNPVGYMMWAIQGLQHVPGRKALVLFTHAFVAPQPLIDLANRAGVVIHVIDTHDWFHDGIAPSTAPYRQLAKQTGGLFLLNAPGPDMAQDLGRVLEDMSSYYLIGYRPEWGESKLTQGRLARHHEIKVRVSRPGLEVRARNGYVGTPEPGPQAVPKTSADYLLEAVSSPFQAGKVRLGLEPRYRASAPAPKTGQRGTLLEVAMPVDGRDLLVADRENGKKELVYSALVMVERQDGTPAAREARTFSVPVTPELAAEVAVKGVRPSLDIRLPGPGAYQVRAAIRDETSGQMGSAYAFVQVPDFNQQKVTLASIELSGSSERWDGGVGNFPAGAPVYFRCGVFGFRKASRPPNEAKVEVQVVLFRVAERKPYSDTRTVTVPAASLAAHTVGGQLDTSGLAPGEYVIQLVAWDRVSGKSAVQWARLGVGQ